MDDCKIIIDELLEQKILINVGKNAQNESFKVVEVESKEKLPVNKNINLFNTPKVVQTLDALTNFFDENFYNTLNNMIKKEVKKVVNDSIKQNYATFINDSIDKNFTRESLVSDNEPLINTLQSEVEFLRKEISSKDTIIKLLLNDRNKSVDLKDNEKKCDVNKINNVINVDEVIEQSFYGKKEGGKYTNIKNDYEVNERSCRRDKKNDEINNEVNKGDNTTHNFNKSNSAKKKRKYRSTVILGDSTIKDIEPHKMREALGKQEKIYIKSFSGADTNAMEHYVKPTIEFENDLIILHFGTNDLRGDKSANDIANQIVNIGKNLKTDNNEIMISGILPRKDNENLHNKGTELNKNLMSLCSLCNFIFINHSYISKSQHLNFSGLHLNIKGTYALANNLLKSIRL